MPALHHTVLRHLLATIQVPVNLPWVSFLKSKPNNDVPPTWNFSRKLKCKLLHVTSTALVSGFPTSHHAVLPSQPLCVSLLKVLKDLKYTQYLLPLFVTAALHPASRRIKTPPSFVSARSGQISILSPQHVVRSICFQLDFHSLVF